jgi:two-component system sensor histidine kinase DesK
VGGLADLWRSDRVVRMAPVAAVVCSALLPLVQVGLAFSYVGNGISTGLWSIAATAAYLPLHLRHVWYAARAHRPPLGGWSLAAMAVVILGATPLAGNMWPRAYTALVVSFLLVLPAPWSYLGYVALVAAAAPVAHALGLSWAAAPWLTFSVLCGSVALLLLVWLAAALIRLQEAREALAQRAVMQERRRIDDDLRHSLGSALESIAARGDRAASKVAKAEPADAARELTGLADDSRRTLAEARRRVRGYRQPSLRAELETAASLLTAAGIVTRLDLPRTGIPDTIDSRPRVALRATLTRLLRAGPTGACTITVTVLDGRVLLEVRAADATETIEVEA